MVNSIEHIWTGTVFSDVQYCLGYCEGEMAHVLMISPQVQRSSMWHTYDVIAGTSKDRKQQIF